MVVISITIISSIITIGITLIIIDNVTIIIDDIAGEAQRPNRTTQTLQDIKQTNNQ